MNDTHKHRVELRRGGWFVIIKDDAQGWSGPWRTEQAANLAGQREYDAAHAAERAQR